MLLSLGQKYFRCEAPKALARERNSRVIGLRWTKNCCVIVADWLRIPPVPMKNMIFTHFQSWRRFRSVPRTGVWSRELYILGSTFAGCRIPKYLGGGDSARPGHHVLGKKRWSSTTGQTAGDIPALLAGMASRAWSEETMLNGSALIFIKSRVDPQKR